MWGTWVCLYDVFDSFEVLVPRFGTWFDNGHKAFEFRSSSRRLPRVSFAHSILSDVKSQKVKPNVSSMMEKRMGNTGFAGFQCETYTW